MNDDGKDINMEVEKENDHRRRDADKRNDPELSCFGHSHFISGGELPYLGMSDAAGISEQNENSGKVKHPKRPSRIVTPEIKIFGREEEVLVVATAQQRQGLFSLRM